MKPWLIWHKDGDHWVVRYERGPEHFIELLIYGDLKMTQSEFRSMLAKIVWERRNLLRDCGDRHERVTVQT